MGGRLALFVIVGICDSPGGFIARRFEMRGAFAAMIDPLAARTRAPPLCLCPAVSGLCCDACIFGPEQA